MSDALWLRGNAEANRPGFAPDRLVRLMVQAIERLTVDLSGLSVLTEAASGAYATTPILAALAGAEWVHAFARDLRYGSCADFARQTLALARVAGVADRVEIVTGSPYAAAGKSQIITNSDNLRPLDSDLIWRLPSNAVIALMHDVGEVSRSDIDVAACRRRGIPVVAVNEAHPQVGLFPYLGCLAVRELQDAGFSVQGCRLALLSNAAFAPLLQRSLEDLGGRIALAACCADIPDGLYDALFVAMMPDAGPALEVDELRHRLGSPPVVQFSGALDRDGLSDAGIGLWPPTLPTSKHRAIHFPAMGPEGLICLMAAGWRAAETVFRHGTDAAVSGSAATLVLQSADGLGERQ